MMPTTKRGIKVMIKPYPTHIAPLTLKTVAAKSFPAAMPTDARKRQMPISRRRRFADELV